MKTKALLACLFVAGIAASFAIAAPPPGKGNPHKAGPTASTGTTGTTGTGTTGTTTTSSDRKVTLCHKTGSKSNPWVKISVSKNAVKAHMNRGDIALEAERSCPKGSKPGGGGTTGTTGKTTGTTTTTTPAT